MISWIKKLFVKSSPVEPEAVAVKELPEKRVKRGRPLGSKTKGVSIWHLKRKPKRRMHETCSNYKTRLKRWEARHDSTEAKGD